MRLQLTGDPDLVALIKPVVEDALLATKASVSRFLPHVTIELQPIPGVDVEIDSLDNPFERDLTVRLRELTETKRIVLNAGVKDDKLIRLGVPTGEELAVARALVKAAHAGHSKGFLRGLFIFGALLLLPLSAAAQSTPSLQEQLDAALTSLARKELQLIEKDRQLASLQLEFGRKLLDADASAAQCQLQTRAEQAAEWLRSREKPESGSTFNLQTGQWVPPEKKEDQK